MLQIDGKKIEGIYYGENKISKYYLNEIMYEFDTLQVLIPDGALIDVDGYYLLDQNGKYFTLQNIL